jgi:hypothetical protein
VAELLAPPRLQRLRKLHVYPLVWREYSTNGGPALARALAEARHVNPLVWRDHDDSDCDEDILP